MLFYRYHPWARPSRSIPTVAPSRARLPPSPRIHYQVWRLLAPRARHTSRLVWCLWLPDFISRCLLGLKTSLRASSATDWIVRCCYLNVGPLDSSAHSLSSQRLSFLAHSGHSLSQWTWAWIDQRGPLSCSLLAVETALWSVCLQACASRWSHRYATAIRSPQVHESSYAWSSGLGPSRTRPPTHCCRAHSKLAAVATAQSVSLRAWTAAFARSRCTRAAPWCAPHTLWSSSGLSGWRVHSMRCSTRLEW